ncbi:MAG: hypothetical protein JXO48_12415 [Deltaproteobacteria bacterium]|nr:hypothetical protein [Deltaproteobacteria bacterium]
MSVIVLVIGLIILGMALALLLSPALLRMLLGTFIRNNWWNIAMMLRVVIGVLLLLAAPGTRAPVVVQVIGVLFVLSGIVIPFMGAARLGKLVNWWLARPDGFLRAWAVAAAVFGALIVWCGI